MRLDLRKTLSMVQRAGWEQARGLRRVSFLFCVMTNKKVNTRIRRKTTGAATENLWVRAAPPRVCIMGGQ